LKITDNAQSRTQTVSLSGPATDPPVRGRTGWPQVARNPGAIFIPRERYSR
jgi:hypothetical protein